MKKLTILFILVLHFLHAFAQDIPEKELKAKNYQEVELFDVDNGFSLVEKFAMYPNGVEGISQHIAENLKYPEKAKSENIEGEVIIQYTVDTCGSVINIQVVQSVNPILDIEAIKVIQKMEKWKPAYQNGKPIMSTYKQSFNFVL